MCECVCGIVKTCAGVSGRGTGVVKGGHIRRRGRVAVAGDSKP